MIHEQSRYSSISPEDRRRGKSPPRDRYRGRSPPPPRGRRGSSRDKYSGCLFIGNIPYHFRENDLRDIFHRAGQIETITIGMNRSTGQPKGHAFIQFYDYRDAQDAHYNYQGHRIDNRPLHIDWDAGMRHKQRSYGGKGGSGGRPYRHNPYDRPYKRSRHSRSVSSSGSPRRGSASPPSRRTRSPRRPSGSRSPVRRDSRSPRSPRRSSISPRRDSPSPRRPAGSKSPARSPLRAKEHSPERTSPPRAASPSSSATASTDQDTTTGNTNDSHTSPAGDAQQ